ncbi:MAG TPA: hypothetical protein VIZ28_07375 [Chitinophagaceae bacterium]
MMATTLSSPGASQQRNLFNTISWTALLAGTLDIAAAIIKYYIEKGKGPAPIFKFIASGVFGKEAFSGGRLMIVWGVVFHFMIAFIFTVVLFLIYPLVIKWIKNKFVTGILYGLLVWVIMNQAVLPLSHTPKFPFDITQAIIAALILISMIGLPVALIADNYYKKKAAF